MKQNIDFPFWPSREIYLGCNSEKNHISPVLSKCKNIIAFVKSFFPIRSALTLSMQWGMHRGNNRDPTVTTASKSLDNGGKSMY